MRFPGLALLVVLSLGSARAARAEIVLDPWIVKGRALLDEGKYAEACAALERSSSESIGAFLMRARCYEGMGRLGSSLRALERAHASARARSDPREETIAAMIPPLSARVGRLVITIATKDVRIAIDGVPLDPQIAVEAIPADKGSHTIVASVRGTPFFRRTAIVEDGGKTRLEVPSPPPAAAPPAPASGASPASVAGISLCVAGGLSLGVAAALGGFAVAEDSITARDAAIGVSIPGGILALTGVVLVLVGAKSPAPRQTWLRGTRAVW